MPDPSDYLTADDIAELLGRRGRPLHPQTVQAYFRDGGLPGRKIGNTWTTTRAALDAWIEAGNAETLTAAATAPLEHAATPLETK